MKSVVSISYALLFGSLGANLLFASPSLAQSLTFACTVDTDNLPTTFAQTPEGATSVFKWNSTFFKPPYTPMQRCQEVTERMNKFHSQGQLDSLTSGIVNKLPVICAGNSCNADGSNVLITLKPNQNPNQVLQELDANRSGAAGPSFQLGGGSTPSSSKPSLLQENADGSLTFDLKTHLGTRTQGSIYRQPPSNQNNNITPSRRSW